MSDLTQGYAKPPAAVTVIPAPSALVQRQCACGGHASPGGECEGCRKQRLAGSGGSQPDADETVQPKLHVNRPGDRWEREADRVAEAVTRAPAQRAEGPPAAVSTLGPPRVQRQAATVPEGKEEEEGVPSTPENVIEMEEGNVSPKRRPGVGHQPPGAAVAGALQHRGDGRRLDASSRGFMERRFGHDFSRVRIHDDAGADRAAHSIGARAFTSGRHIWFARGEYSPATHHGRQLLAHELTHTLQQQGGASDAAGGLVQRAVCPDACSAPVSRGELCRAPRVTRDNCGGSAAENDSNKITHIRVLLDTRKVHLFWNGAPDTATGTKEEIDCSPNPSATPTGADKVGVKCGPAHTSWKRYNMAWFTGFKSTGYRIGFHDSQPVGAGFNSAGCVRVSCEDAEKINKNTSSDETSIMVRNSSAGD
jgi:hypothetical protein